LYCSIRLCVCVGAVTQEEIVLTPALDDDDDDDDDDDVDINIAFATFQRRELHCTKKYEKTWERINSHTVGNLRS